MALAIFKNKKLRPWLIGGVVLVGGLVLFVMMRAKGSSDGGTAYASGPSESLQLAQLQAGAASQNAQLQANVALAQLATDAESYRYGQDTALAMAGLDAQTAQYMAASQTSIQLAGIQAQENIAKAQEGTAQMGIAAQASVQQAGLVTQQNIAAYQYQFMTEQERQETARVNIQASVAKKQSSNNLLGSVFSAVGAVAGIFSDARLKRDIAWTGETIVSRGPGRPGFESYGRYTWTYNGDTTGTRYAGVIAQEIGHVAPYALVQSRQSRFIAVDYAGLPG